MYVIMDMEWILSHGVPCPTQIAALRVDGHWRRMGSFQSLIRPRDPSCHRWNHMAYTGADREQFLRAPTGTSTFCALFRWLRDDDVLLWWEGTAASVFQEDVRHILKREVSQQTLLLKAAAVRVCQRSGDPYQLAEAQGLHVPGPQHASVQDVEAIRALLAGLRLRPEAIRGAQSGGEPPVPAAKYLYDPAAKLLHTANGGCRVENPQRFATFKSCLRRGFRPCPACCAAEFRRESMRQSAIVISNTQYNFIYREASEVFHKAECVHARRIPYWEIRGAALYSSCVELGKRPCRLCKPTPDYRKPHAVSAPSGEAAAVSNRAERALLPGFTRELTAEESRAYSRHLKAAKKRTAIAPSGDAATQEDAYRLSCSGYAFWAARGYENFHLANCPRLQGLTRLEGFSRYSHAINRGFSPCRHCRPSPKDDLVVSVPSGSEIRSSETAELLDRLCRGREYRGHREGGYYHIETPVGKWKLDISARPIDLWHINLAKDPGGDFHRQPRMILSLSDAFRYIDRHDRALMARQSAAGRADCECESTPTPRPSKGE